MLTILRVAALAWGDAVIDGAFFIMQTYLTQVWKLNFTTAATFLNIWGGIYRILPLFFLFLADTFLGNFKMLAVSGISSTMGLVLITLATTPLLGYSISFGSCEEKETSCVGNTEKALFFTGMTLVALGKASRFASTEAFIKEQNGDHGSNLQKWWLLIPGIVFFVTPTVAIFAFPYVKLWYVLFGASALCTASATLFYLLGYRTYKKPGPREEGSPITDIVRVFVAAVFFKRSRAFPKDDEGKLQLHVVRGEQFQELSRCSILGFLHKAAIITDDDRNAGSGEVKKRSWKVCSVSEVESVKIFMRALPLWSCFITCGVVSSIGNTYFIEQMSHMKSNMGSWNAPPQVVLLIFIFSKYFLSAVTASMKLKIKKHGALKGGLHATSLSVACCAVAGAVEKRRLHVVRRHHILDDQTQTPMSAFWIMLPFMFLAVLDPFFEFALSRLHERAPKSMERYHDCFSEGVIGFGFMCGALSVYVVGIISDEAGAGGNGWFQETLNRSRLDRYYWVLTVLSVINAAVFMAVIILPILGNLINYMEAEEAKNEDDKHGEEAENEDDKHGEDAENEDDKHGEDAENDDDKEAENVFRRETALEVLGIKKSSALGIILPYFRITERFVNYIIQGLEELSEDGPPQSIIFELIDNFK